MQCDCLEVQDKLNQSREKYKRAALLLAELNEDMEKKRDNILCKTDHEWKNEN
jgi:hypothetical protein